MFNVGADTPYTVLQLAEEVAAAFDKPRQVRHLPPRNEVVHAFSDHTRARKAFNPPPPVDLPTGITRMAGLGQDRGPTAPVTFSNLEFAANCRRLGVKPIAVSVIVSNFNGEHCLRRLLETLRAQRGDGLEMIVVDRHSRDDSKKLLAQYPSVLVMDEPPESGLVCGYASAVSRGPLRAPLLLQPRDVVRRKLPAPPRVADRLPAGWRRPTPGSGPMTASTGSTAAPASPGRWNLQSPYPFRAYAFVEPVADNGAAAVPLRRGVPHSPPGLRRGRRVGP